MEYKKKKTEDYDILINELKSYEENLVKKPRIICLTKIDALTPEQVKELGKIKFNKGKQKYPVLKISSVSGENIQKLIDEIWIQLQQSYE